MGIFDLGRYKGIVFAITGFLLFLQGLAEVIRCVLCIRTGQWPQRLHDVEETESLVIREHQAAEQESGKGAGA